MQGGFAEAVQNTNHGSFFTRNCKRTEKLLQNRFLEKLQFCIFEWKLDS